ncbi:hypothetical protein [Bacillus rubiinfantis]|uniref:hypothetical protein n=1 Tax=Bacillus rubiinfantis TaxID=1499680 RepID=UPI0005A6ED6F|nr:hypothetical protein [Bacillus rubiinfantis]
MEKVNQNLWKTPEKEPKPYVFNQWGKQQNRKKKMEKKQPGSLQGKGLERYWKKKKTGPAIGSSLNLY